MTRIRIGFAAPLTGPQAVVGIPMLRVVQLAAREWGAGGVEFEVTALDDAADEGVAIKVAEEFVADAEIVAVIGHKNSGPSRAGAPVYAAAGLVQLSQCATDNKLTRSGWRTFFRLCADNERQAHVAAEHACGDCHVKRLVAVHDGTAYGRPLVEAFCREAAAGCMPTTSVMEMAVGQEDFSGLVAAVKIGDPDLIYIGGTEIEASKLARALRAADVSAQLMTSEGGPHNPFAWMAGVAGEGSLHTYAGANPASTEPARQIAERCLAELGAVPSFVVECWDAVTAIAEGLTGGARSRAEIREAIAQTNIEGLAGPIRFGPNGDRIDAPVSLWQVRGGTMVAMPV